MIHNITEVWVFLGVRFLFILDSSANRETDIE